MDKPSFIQQDMLNGLLAAHSIYAGSDATEEKIIVERLELHLGHPAGVGLRASRVHALSTVRRRRPVHLVPAAPPLLLNRGAELETLRQAMIARGVADLHGPDGTGKSTLAAALAHNLDLNHFPDGAVFAAGPIRFPDLLQALFDSFYESDTPVKVTVQQTHTYLRNLRVLVILDDVGLGPKQIDPILDALHEAAVLIVGPERTALGRGRALPLKGLPHQEAVALFKKTLERASSPDESSLIDPICTLLNDMPLPISRVAAHVAENRQTFTKVLTDLQGRKPWAGPGGAPSVGPSLEQIILDLDATGRELLTMVAAFARPSASSEALETIMQLPTADFQEHIKHLQELGLIHTVRSSQRILSPNRRKRNAPRLSLASAYYQTARSWLVDDAARRQVINYYTTRLSRDDRLPGDELRCLLGAFEDCAHNGWLDHLKPLVRAADRSLAKARWWAEWQHFLDLTRRAAQSGGDRALEAWAMHQLGSLLGSLGEYERAFHLLETAASIRRALGDQAGADLSARNIGVLEQLLPAPTKDTIPSTEAPGETQGAAEESPRQIPTQTLPDVSATDNDRPSRLKLRLALLAAAVVLAVGTLALQFIVRVGDSRDETPDWMVSWEFGDAWNSLDNQTWTQQVKIVVEGDQGSYRYFVDDEPVKEMFEVVSPLCDGARGTIRVESDSGQSAMVEYEFDSPYCH